MTTNNAVNVGLSGATGTGNFVGATSPTLVTPALGTPTSGTLTSCTGLPISGIASLGTGVGTALAANVTGSGGIVLATSPSLVTPALGTPASGTLTNCTGYPSGNLVNGGYVLLGSVTASSQATVAFTSLSGSSYSQYVIIINNVLLATAAQNLTLQISTGSGLLTTNYSYASWRWTTAANGQGGGTAQSAWAINSNGETLGNTVNNNEASFKVNIFGANSIVPIRSYTSEGYYKANSATLIATMQQGQVLTNAAAIDGMQIASTSGNITSGNFYLYGIKNS